MEILRLKDLADNDELPFHAQFGYYDYGYPPHMNEDFSELAVVLEGSGVHVVGDDSHELHKGTVFVVGKGIAHEFRDTKGMMILFLFFTEDIFGSCIGDFYADEDFRSLFEQSVSSPERYRSYVQPPISEFDKVENTSKYIHWEYVCKETGWKQMIHSLFVQLTVLLVRAYHDSATAHYDSRKKLEPVMTYIEKHFTEEISVDLLAEIAHYSRRHFIRLFKETYTMLPMEYVIHLRMTKACSLLKDTNKTMTEIALLCGYTDNNYFSRIFRNSIGMTPREYRKNKRAE